MDEWETFLCFYHLYMYLVKVNLQSMCLTEDSKGILLL
jgi:hypothetical protein